MKPVKYTLAVNEPGSYDLWNSFDSATPFANISVGDIINPGMWDYSQAPMKVLLVKKVMHSIWENEDEIRHTVAIFSEEVKRTEELAGFH